jgi:hypothetical protein
LKSTPPWSISINSVWGKYVSIFLILLFLFHFLRETSLQHLSSIVHWVLVIRYIFFSFRCLKQLKMNITGQIMVSQWHYSLHTKYIFSSNAIYRYTWRMESFSFLYIWNQKCSIQYPVLHKYYTAWFSLVRIFSPPKSGKITYLCENLNQKY